MDSYYAELSASDLETVRFEGLGDLDCLCIGKDGIEGWHSTPTPKVSATARGQGDGGHDVSEDDIIYASRTVTLHWNANASSRQSLIELTNKVRRFVHRHVRLRVVDGIEDTYCEQGYLSMSQEPKYREGKIYDSEITIVFERPERLSSRSHDGEARAATIQSGGLSYGSAHAGLSYPLSYGVVSGGATLCRLPNDGTSRAYPTFTINGDWPSGVSLYLNCEGRRTELRYDSAIHLGTPVLLDTRTRTATLGGVDVSRHLSSRGWRTIPAGKALTVLLGTAGNGWVTCSSRDTYM